MSTDIILPPTKDLFNKGRDILDERQAQKEADAVGNLRGGNVGLLLPDGTVTGKCHRLSMLRSMGVEIPQSESEKRAYRRRKIMFDLGNMNEDAWKALLQEALPEGYEIHCEEEIPVRWSFDMTGPEGIDRTWTVTGRPDQVIIKRGPDGEVIPVRTLEHKSMASVYTLINAGFRGVPNLEHLCQVGHYAWKHNSEEAELWYTCYVDFHAPTFFKLNPVTDKWEVTQDEAWPEGPTAPMGELLEWNPPQKGKSKARVKKAGPMYSGYAINWDAEGNLKYRWLTGPKSQRDTWHPTIITQDAIEGYYRFVAHSIMNKDLGPRVKGKVPSGDPMTYNPCTYCDLYDLCVHGEKLGFDVWLSMVKDRVAVRARIADQKAEKREEKRVKKEGGVGASSSAATRRGGWGGQGSRRRR